VRGKLTVEAVNERLRSAKVGVFIEQKGKRLYLRATLPPKPGAKNTKPHQQYVSLQIYANPAGLERAEAEARKLGALIACKEFDWTPYLRRVPKDKVTCKDWVEHFKKYCLSTNLQSSDDAVKAELLWRKRYYSPALKWLPENAELTPAAIITVAQRSKPNSRSRQVACWVLQQLAKFAEVDVDLKPYIGNYSPKKAAREIPTDEAIVAAIDNFTLPTRRCLYALMATYGLRDHEVFFTPIAPPHSHRCWTAPPRACFPTWGQTPAHRTHRSCCNPPGLA